MAIARSLFLAVAVALALAACNSDDLPPAAKFTTVAGVVVDRTTSAPIAGALVTIDAILTATTDSAGKFSIQKVPSGDYDVTVQAKGYADLTTSGRADPGKEQALDLQLNVASP